MTNANGKNLAKAIRGSKAANVLVAALLILLGIVFQLSELGYGHIRPENFWLFSMIASSAWNVAAAHINAPGAHEILAYWPVVLIGVGVSALLVAKANGHAAAGTSAGAPCEK